LAGFDLTDALTQIMSLRGLDKDFVILTLKESILAGVKKKFGTSDNLEVDVDGTTGDITVKRKRNVVEEVEDADLEVDLEKARSLGYEGEVGGELVETIPLEEFGRSAIMVAKQIMFQRVREAERERIYEGFSERIGDIVTGTVQQVDKRGVIVNLGRTEAILPLREQIYTERIRQGQTVRAFILDVRRTSKGPQVVLSRTHPDFLKKLFQFEVPEVYEGVVQIKSVAREPGDRSKIAVYSKDDKIDPVGACVGVKGSRVQAVVRELNGEKIDVVQWSSDTMLFVSRSLSPAKVQKCVLNERAGSARVVIADDQYSLAIGRGGQNARLAAKLTGLKIDILSESQYREQLERDKESLAMLVKTPGISARMVDRLILAGYSSASDIAQSEEKDLISIKGIGRKTAEKIIESAIHINEEMKRRAEEEAREAEESRLQEERARVLAEAEEESEEAEGEGDELESAEESEETDSGALEEVEAASSGDEKEEAEDEESVEETQEEEKD
jgi:N utilization substance protein A